MSGSSWGGLGDRVLRNLVRNVSMSQRKEGPGCRAPRTLESAGKLESLQRGGEQESWARREG